jgi:hypothetical protein
LSKREIHKQELIPLFESVSAEGSSDALTGYLVTHSNLPGPRGNLELAQAFADAVACCTTQEAERLWALCLEMTAISPDEAPVNDPREFIPFCGTVGLGALSAAMVQYVEPALQALHELANDSRWRMREGVCFGLQRLIAVHPQQIAAALEGWVADGNWLELRAAAAAVAEPALLLDPELARSALCLHERILDRVLQARDRRSEPFKALRKGLGYTLSVVVGAIPDEGFAWLARLVDAQDADVLWIVRQNLKKNRLVRHYPERVETLARKLVARTLSYRKTDSTQRV